mgnify:CR=1 FL=1
MKILNLYAGIGGNRKLWGDNLDITAVEWDEKIAAIYADLWPNDRVIIGDAHQYLLDHFHEYDFIWSSPPCPTHSQTNIFLHAQGVVRYPDMKLWQEIIFLNQWHKGKWVVENVKPYYGNFARIGTPQVRGRHWFWANFRIPHGLESVKIGRMAKLKNCERGDGRHRMDGLGFDLSGYGGIQKEKLLRNCVTPEIGLAIYQAAQNIHQANRMETGTLFQES